MIRFNSTGVQKPKCPVMSRLSTTSCPPWSGIVINKTVTSSHLRNQLSLAKTIASKLNQIWKYRRVYIELFRSAKIEVSYYVEAISSFRSPTVWASHKQAVTSCHICNQLSMAKTIASPHSNQRVPSWLHSTFQECKKRSVLLCQDYQKLPVFHGLGRSFLRQ